MKSELNLDFLDDSPITGEDSEFFKFYHEYVEPALNKVVDKKVHTIGLFGRWGTGKSTIIKILEKKSKNSVYVFDTWKYQKDPLRRTFLIDLYKFVLKNKNSLLKKNHSLGPEFLDDIYHSKSEQTQKKITSHNTNSKAKRLFELIKKRTLVVAGIVFLLSWSVTQLKLGESHPVIHAVLSLAGIFGQSASATLVLGWAIKKAVDNLIDNFMDDLSKKTNTITTIKSRDFLNSPEQFENKFKTILQNLKSKIIIVFDNIDRLNGEEAVRVLSTIKTFLEPKDCNNVVFVIPCDYDAIKKQIEKSYQEDAPEFLRKLFSLTIWTPEFINADLEDYTLKLIAKTGNDSHLLKNPDVTYVIRQAYSDNPRQIKQFINNLIAELYVASNTEVWNTIKDNIGYLAKVLVIKQEFPKAYDLLKKSWATPDNIIPKESLKTESGKRLADFMENTRPITTSNASPYLYFKQPVRADNVHNSEEIEKSLLSEDIVTTHKLITTNNDFEAVVSFILALYDQYSSLKSELRKIVTSSIKALNKTGKTSSNHDYYNTTARIIDKEIWQDYSTFPSNEIFSYLINSPHIKVDYKKALVDRYLSVLGIEANHEPDKRIMLLTVFKLLHQFQEHLSKPNKATIAKEIQDTFSTDTEIISEFSQTENDIKVYISDQTILNLVQGIKLETYGKLLPLVIKLKNKIIDSELTNTLLQNIADTIKTETSEASDFRPEKDQLFSTIIDCINKSSEILQSLDQEYANTFAESIINAIKNISDPDNKILPIELLQYIYQYTSPEIQTICLSVRKQFISQASTLHLTTFLDYEKEIGRSETIISEDIGEILTISNSNPDKRQIFYKYSQNDNQTKIINDLVKRDLNTAIEFLKVQHDVPSRVSIINQILEQVETIAPGKRLGIYNWIAENLLDNDPIETKEKLSDQIRTLLETDDSTISNIGFTVYTNTKAISKASKRSIAQHVLDWLREPTRILSVDSKWALDCVIYAIQTLNLEITPKKDFVHYLLKNLQTQTNKDLQEMILASLININASYTDNIQSFEDTITKIDNWEDVEKRKYVLEKLLELKPKRMSANNKEFWGKVTTLYDTTQKSLTTQT